MRDLANAAWSAIIPLVFVPDDMVLWVGGAVRAGTRAHDRAPVDAIYSSSPPISDHLAAGLLARRIRKPWIADFRDPWIGNAFARPLPAPHRAVQRRIERWIVERAERVVLATETMRRQFADRYPQRAERFIHIPNGYDPADLALPGGEPPFTRAVDGQFRLVHAGSVYGADAFSLFLDGVERLLTRDPSVRDRLRVKFVGWFSEASQAIARRRLPRLEPVVRQTGFVPRSQAIAIERAANAGLIVLAGSGNRAPFATTKLYEYLGLGLPVLAVVPPGEVREILGRLDWGVIADPTVDGVARGIERIMAADRPERFADPDGRYDRRSLAAELAALLDAVASPGRAEPSTTTFE
jgi:glycosyltransferase involved in cell wall biosynthesis